MEIEVPRKSGPKKPASASLKTLNELSQKRTFAVDDVDWTQKVDHSLDWMPRALVSASYLPAWKLLTDKERLRFNQLTSLSIAEQFIWFEEDLLCPILRHTLKTARLTPELRECLENFVAEEERHSIMFRKLIEKANPAANEKYVLFNLAGPQKFFFNQVISKPDTFLVWIWMAIYFEEKTLHFSQLYKSAGESVDGLFRRCHYLHSVDEARHLQIDQYLLESFYETAPAWKRAIAGKLAQTVFAAYRSPHRIAKRVLNILRQESSNPAFDQLEAELPLLGTNQEFGQAMFGPQAINRTRQLLQLYPETIAAYRTLTK